MSRKKRSPSRPRPQPRPCQLGRLLELRQHAKELSVVIQFLTTTDTQSVTYQGATYAYSGERDRSFRGS
jgi:hypothetical protein